MPVQAFVSANQETIPPSAESPAELVLCSHGGHRVEVLYVWVIGNDNRYDMMADTITDSLWRADYIFDASAHKTNGHRHIRYLMTDDCQIAVRQVQVGRLQSGHVIEDVAALGYDQPDRKYVLFIDAFTLGMACGGAVMQPDDTPGIDNRNNATSYIHLYLGCWNGATVAHELVHSFGGVQLSAPNSSGGNHCIDGVDIMCYRDAPFYPQLRFVCKGVALLDCNNDDYFHTSPEDGSYLAEHWNTADSVFLTSEERRVLMPWVTN